MFKRNGLEIMSNKLVSAQSAKDIIKILDDKKYLLNDVEVDISNEINYCLNNSVLYDEVLPNRIYKLHDSIIEITLETTTQAAMRLLKTDSNVVALNFASGKQAGGGFLSGAKAQEEDLCRSSALFGCLQNNQKFFTKTSHIGSDNVLYSPDVPFFKEAEDYIPFYKLSILTCAAPNLNGEVDIEDDLEAIYYQRIDKILNVAKSNGHESIVLGAWGCGAFRNDPNLIALTFKKLLPNYGFKHVVFAVYDSSPNKINFNAFDRGLTTMSTIYCK